MKEDFLDKKLEERRSAGSYRRLRLHEGLIDFCSNDYLGLSSILSGRKHDLPHGSTGSRLLAGNYALVEDVEKEIAQFHAAEAGLIFNSGYDANIGLLSAVPQKNDTVIYDALSHASIRDGIRLSVAQSFSFHHNDLFDLEKKLQAAENNVFVVTESVFSMDGDISPLREIVALCEKYEALLIVDEAHATGVIGKFGEGLVQSLGLANRCFARVHTFGKSLGCHGAIVLGSDRLRNYLINFARSLIYTTALPPSAIQVVREAYTIMSEMGEERLHLQRLIQQFQQSSIRFEKLVSNTAIQAIVIAGNNNVKAVAEDLRGQGYDVRPILYPTVPLNTERIRIVLHSFNTNEQLKDMLKLLK